MCDLGHLKGSQKMSKQDENKKKEGGNSVMLKVATFIVDRRNLFFLLIGIALIFCAIASRWVKVENDLAAYLPDSAETSRGISLMNDQFITYGSARLMVTNITYDEACDICDEISGRDDVTLVSFGDGSDHYNDFSALYDITFAYPEDDERCLDGLDEIKSSLEGYDIYVSTSMGDQAAETIAQEMKVVSALVVVVVLSVLIFT